MKDWRKLTEGQVVYWYPQDCDFVASWKAVVVAVEEDHAIAVTEGVQETMELWIDDDTIGDFF